MLGEFAALLTWCFDGAVNEFQRIKSVPLNEGIKKCVNVDRVTFSGSVAVTLNVCYH